MPKGSNKPTIWYMEKAEQSEQHLGIKTTINPAEDNRKKQCKPNQTNPKSDVIHPSKSHTVPAHTERHNPPKVWTQR